jgi:hypothetical protein
VGWAPAPTRRRRFREEAHGKDSENVE